MRARLAHVFIDQTILYINSIHQLRIETISSMSTNMNANVSANMIANMNAKMNANANMNVNVNVNVINDIVLIPDIET
jgi:hypothetical protein